MRARAGYQAPTASGTGIPVFDSVEVGLSNDTWPKILVVGWIGDPDDLPDPPGSTSQTIATLGTLRHRTEEGEVRLAAAVSYGDGLVGTGAADAGTIGAARDEAFAIVNDVDAMVRADPTLGLQGAGYPHLIAYVASVDQIVLWLNEGHKVRVEFTVHFEARI